MQIVIVAVLLALTQALVPVPGQTPDSSIDRGSSIQQSPTDKQNPATVQPVQSPPQSDGAQKSKDQLSNTNAQETVVIREPVSVSKDWWDRAYVIFTGLLVAIGFGGVVAALKTLRAIERQTFGLIESERAWIIGELVPICMNFGGQWYRPAGSSHVPLNSEEILSGEHHKHRLKIINMGRTPATILGCDIEYMFVGESDVRRIPVPGVDLALGGHDSIERPVIDIHRLKNGLIAEMGDSKKHVEFRGFIEYQTVFDRSEVYTASFRYIYDPKEIWFKRMPQEGPTKKPPG